MGLPKLNTVEYFETLPVSKIEVKFRPFNVKEQKILLQTLEDGTPQSITGNGVAVDTSTSITNVDLSGASNSTTATSSLGVGTNGQIKIIVMTTAPSTSSQYRVNIAGANWGSTTTSSNQIVLNAQGESVTLLFGSNNKWYAIASNGAGVVN